MSGEDTGSRKCCVCSSEAVVTVAYGGRAYCRGCLEKAGAHRRGLGYFEIGALLLLVGLGALVNGVAGEPGGWRLFLSLVFLLLVSIVFIVLFYRQDRLEPEPKMLVALTVLGGMAVYALVNPLLHHFFQFESWGSAVLLDGVLLYGLVFGLLVEFGKYLLVRYTLFMDEEYDEIADGVVYGSLAGVGFATAFNLQYVFSAGGVDLFVGSVRMATTVLMHASISGFVGYFLAREKFAAGRGCGPALALSLSAVMWGGYYFLTRAFSTGSLGYSPWKELLLLVVYSFAISSLTLLLMHRGQKSLLAASGQGGAA